ncbi:MAG TPA: DNA repair protein RecO [Candidatus Gemmiger faecigallinarum]|nr:DNA repair protein RecO [Candidatus Gemmiger faecigallinarum]
MQQTATTGLVLRQVKVGEADQILTLLTPDLGVVSASARGSLRPKNKLFSACGLFCYSEFVITAGRSSHFVDSAQIKRSFHGLSQSVEGMALAMYMAEVAAALSPAPPESAEHLRLLLNSLYMLSESKRPLPQLKVIYELRAMTLSGYMPQLLACASCGRYDGGDFYLDPAEGTLLCADCARRLNRTPNLDAGALYALRHICLAEDKKLFAFTLTPQSLKRLGSVSERYLLAHLGQGLKSLDFLKTLGEL